MAADSDSGNDSGGSSDSGPEEVQRRTSAASSAGEAQWRRRMHLMEMAGASDASEDISDGGGASGRSAGSVSGSEISDGDMSDHGASPSDEDDGVEDVPFEVLAAQRAGDVAAGPNGAAMGPSGGALTGKRRSGSKGGGSKDRPHRENKNRPAEASSRRPVGRLRAVVQGPHIERKDPRFEDLSGRYDPGRFRKQYAFLYDEALPQERAAVKAKLKKVRGAGAKDALAGQARQLDATLREDALRQKKGRFEAELKAKERAAVRAGKKPFFLKKADKRKAELVAQYVDLQKAGQLDKYLAKRRRKNAAKDHRYVPSARAT